MPPHRTDCVETIVIGNGPAALILSYILHGNIPKYTGGHWDHWLDKKLQQCTDLLHIPSDVYGHLQTSIQYSAQALPFNTLLDTLLRPKGDLSSNEDSCVRWDYEPSRARAHLLLGSAPEAGGQWADEPESTSYEIGTLSYAEQLSLPAYSFRDHWQATKGEGMPELIRPARADCSAYYAAYPSAVGIDSSLRNSTRVSGIRRDEDGYFVIESHKLRCKNLVLASGIFNSTIEPPASIAPLRSLSAPAAPLLVVGSGFTAADIIISAPPERKIIHVFNWDPDNRPSPLRACHSTAYPDYAYIYKRMKVAASSFSAEARRPSAGGRRGSSLRPPKMLPRLPHFSERDWTATYEGHANAQICISEFHCQETKANSRHLAERQSTATIRILDAHDKTSESREIGGFFYAAGRRGTLTFLDQPLLDEVVPASPTSSPHPDKGSPWTDVEAASHGVSSKAYAKDAPPQHLISGQTLREKIASTSMDVEIAPHAFVVGSLTGDSLVRFAFGGCCLAAGKIMDDVS